MAAMTRVERVELSQKANTARWKNKSSEERKEAMAKVRSHQKINNIVIYNTLRNLGR